MNMEETIEAIKVMQAFVDGETITAIRPHEDRSNEVEWPIWNWQHCEYEVKPKPREAWVAFKQRADFSDPIHCISIDRPDWKLTQYDYVLMREVTE